MQYCQTNKQHVFQAWPEILFTLVLFARDVHAGEFPVMTPGKVHEYASCTTFSTTSEYMEGYYTFHRLKNKEEVFDVAIPRFHMVCPPFRESMVRSVSQYCLPSVWILYLIVSTNSKSLIGYFSPFSARSVKCLLPIMMRIHQTQMTMRRETCVE